MCINTKRKHASRMESASFQWQDKRQWAQTEVQRVHSEHTETLFHCVKDQTREQAEQWGGRASIPGDILKMSAHCLGKWDLNDPA